jgi:hypothetical protein
MKCHGQDRNYNHNMPEIKQIELDSNNVWEEMQGTKWTCHTKKRHRN